MTPRDRATRPAGAGVTLIELVVVLAILAVAVALVLPAVGRGTETVQLRREAGRVAALLREARQQAVTQRRPTRVTLDRARNTVTLSPADTGDTGDSDDAKRLSREVAMPPGFRLRVDKGRDSLTFSSRGLTRETRWLLDGSGKRTLAIEVQAVSGRVSVVPEARS